MDLSRQLLSDIIVYMKYAKYNEALKRRETWDEIVTRNKNMHLKRFPDLRDEIDEAYKLVYEKKVLPSMRSMQFGGRPIEINPTRGYNCSYTPINHVDTFSEIMFLLLSGTGVGYSTQFHHVEELPIVRGPLKRNRRFLVGDSIEGWSDAIKVLMNAYFFNKSNPVFDYGDIRPKGSALVTSGGKAPGPQPLKDCIHNIRKILDNVEPGEKLTPLQVHDIVCFIADSVLTGGIRRASCINFFSLSDEETLTCKYGVWWEKNAQRGRANNSAVLLRHRIRKKDFKDLWDKIEKSNSGEPGFFFTNDKECLSNPCQPADATLLTPFGITTMGQVKIGDVIWSGKRWTKIVKKWETGVKPVFEHLTTAGTFLGTKEHKVVSGGKKVQVQDATTIDVSELPEVNLVFSGKTKEIMDGLLIGDGSVHKASGNLVGLHIGQNDGDYFQSEIAHLLKEHRTGISKTFWTVEESSVVTDKSLCHTYNRQIPSEYFYGNVYNKAAFLRGLYSANGSVVDQRVTLKSASFDVVRDVQIMLSSIGIRSYYTCNKSKKVTFSNGEYRCKQSWDLNISTDRDKFLANIGFLQKYKMEKLLSICQTIGEATRRKNSYEIKERKYRGDEQVFDIMVEADEHTYWTGGLLVSNCVEASLKNNQYCNLCEVNVDHLDGQEDFNNRVRAASFIGTLQASYTNFHYLRDSWIRNTERDALLGVGLTGIASGEVLKLNLEEAANIVVEQNKKTSKVLGIKPAARTTLVKPSGTASLFLNCSSGIHAWHAPFYIRRVRVMKNEPIYNYLKKKLPKLIEDDFEKPHIGAIISVPIKAPDNAILRDESALSLLERVKTIHEEWIKPGHVKGSNTHNVSCTVSIKDDEWVDVGEWLWKNKRSYNGISVLPYSGGTYTQAPLEEITEEKYKELYSHLKQINLAEIKEEEDTTDLKGEQACSGGSCDISLDI